MSADVKARHQAFRALLAALAMPGTRRHLPEGGGLPLILDAVYGGVVDGRIVVHSELRPEVVDAAERGEELAPERGATLFLLVDEATPWTTVRIQGPGVRRDAQLRVPFSAETLAARARACAAPPLGIDIVVVEGDTVSAFPRTTKIEVLR